MFALWVMDNSCMCWVIVGSIVGSIFNGTVESIINGTVIGVRKINNNCATVAGIKIIDLYE